MRKTLTWWAISLAPSALILAAIGVGAAMGMSLFRLAWENDFLFGLLVIAVLLPLSKLPLLLLGKVDDEFTPMAFPGFPENERERAAQIQMLQARLERLRDLRRKEQNS